MKRKISLPKPIEEIIKQSLATKKISLNESRLLGNSILRLSDFFIHHPSDQTPWDKDWAQLAYMAYFFPLNFIRLTSIIEEILKFNFLKGIKTLIDFGSGPGTAGLAFHDKTKMDTVFCERSPIPGNLVKPHSEFLNHSTWVSRPQDFKAFINHQSLIVFSYSLTEMTELPQWALNSEALLLVEPSTQQDGRKLLLTRNFLIEKGYQIYAPCIHQGSCPLLIHSKKDWCHDRVAFNRPDWFEAIEAFLPMRNPSVTMSYLFARKSPLFEVNPEFSDLLAEAHVNSRIGRTIGDPLSENGKVKQLFCRGSDREFLVWLSRYNNLQEFDRGVLIKLPEDIEKKSNEIRVKSKLWEV